MSKPDEFTPVTADKITMGQLIDLYRTSESADIVRAAMLLIHGDPLLASFREPAAFERAKAAALCADAWNRREAAGWGVGKGATASPRRQGR